MSGAPEAGTWIGATVTVLGYVIVRAAKWIEDRRRKTAMESVPHSTLPPPGPAVDAAVLRRLQRLEEHDVLTTALTRSERRVDDIEQLVQDLRRQIERLTVQRDAERAVNSLKDSMLEAKQSHIVRLEEDLARARVKRRGGAIEVSTAGEHQDASTISRLQEAIRTPLRPPRG